MKVYTDLGNHPVVHRLRSFGVIIVQMERSRRLQGHFWRFLAASDDYEHIIFRDADSRLNRREATAVDQWIASGKLAHAMFDNRRHVCSRPLFGGMWGVRGGVIRNMKALIDKWGKQGKYGDDMRFLHRVIWPLVKHSVMIHSSVKVKWDSLPFPTEGKLHVGKVITPRNPGIPLY